MMPAMAHVDRFMKLAGLSFVLAALAACKSSAPPAPTGPKPPEPVAEATFDGLFKAGTSWRFTVRSESSMWDDTDPAADANGNVTTESTSETSCKVTATVTFPGGRASEVECAEGTDWRVSERIAGVWIQTTEGLWHDTSLPEEGKAPTLDPATRFLAAAPTPVSKRDEEPESPDGPSGGSGSTLDIEPSGDGWCVSTAYWGGDESWQKLCIDSVGPAAGSTGFAGGSTSEVTFERID